VAKTSGTIAVISPYLRQRLTLCSAAKLGAEKLEDLRDRAELCKLLVWHCGELRGGGRVDELAIGAFAYGSDANALVGILGGMAIVEITVKGSLWI